MFAQLSHEAAQCMYAHAAVRLEVWCLQRGDSLVVTSGYLSFLLPFYVLKPVCPL